MKSFFSFFPSAYLSWFKFFFQFPHQENNSIGVQNWILCQVVHSECLAAPVTLSVSMDSFAAYNETVQDSVMHPRNQDSAQCSREKLVLWFLNLMDVAQIGTVPETVNVVLMDARRNVRLPFWGTMEVRCRVQSLPLIF